ncbi:MAG: hypothetical protein ABL893_03335 [Hyphomicrobium sp.]|nr:hypothetical protein [Hyphomicrobium sp.]
MKRFATFAMTALLAASTAIPAVSTPAEARNRGAKIAAGVVLGAAALAIIANQNRANASEYRGERRSRSGFWRTCDKWLNQCNRGNNYACEKYETRGCTE